MYIYIYHMFVSHTSLTTPQVQGVRGLVSSRARKQGQSADLMSMRMYGCNGV